jgi:hypothetical protein
MKRSLLVFCIFLISLLFIAPHLAEFAFPVNSQYSDLVISHYPNTIYIKQSLQQWKQVPLWSDTILSGYPFFADPLSGLWYPLNWLLLVLPLPLGFNLLFILHLLWGGMGLYFFLLRKDLHPFAAVAGGLSFILMPKIFSHFATGHVTLIFAVAWTPWLLYVEEIIRQSRQGKWRRLLPGVILGIIALADVRWVLFSGLLWFAYRLTGYIQAIRRGKLAQDPQITDAKENPAMSLRYFVLDTLLQGLLAFSISAVLLIPLIQYAGLSTRSGLTPADNLYLSLSPLQLFGLIFPDFGVYAEWALYPGALACILLLLTLVTPALRKKTTFWSVLIGISLLYALGENIPFLGVIQRLPGINLLRVPTRILFIAGLAFSILSATAIDALIKEEIDRHSRVVQFILVIFSAFTLMFALGLWWITGNLPLEFIWGSVFVAVFSILILTRIHGRLGVRPWLALLLPLLVLDLGTVNNFAVHFTPANKVQSQGEGVARYLSAQDDNGRVYSPSYSIPQQTAVHYGLQLADGIDPMQLENYVQFMEKASGVPYDGYSVTLPPFASGEPQTANAAFSPDAERLGWLNVAYVTSEFDMKEANLEFITQFDNTRVYRNRLVLPRAYILTGPTGNQSSILEVSDLEITPNWISLRAEGPGLLVLSEVNYPGWEATVDGQQVQILDYESILRSVELGGGTHQVRFRFRPGSLHAGAILSFAGWVLFFLSMIIYRSNSEVDHGAK